MEQQTIADYPVGGAATTPTFRYVFASYIDEPVVRKTAGVRQSWAIADFSCRLFKNQMTEILWESLCL
jgi:hypothetical protein